LKFSFSSLALGIRDHLRNRSLLYLYFIGFILLGSFVSLFNYIGYLLTAPPYGLSQTLVGFVYVVYITGIFSSAWISALADRTARYTALALAVFGMLAGAAITLAPLLAVKIAGLTIFAAGFFAAHAVASGWVAGIAARDKALASSLYLVLYYVGSSVIGSTGGLFWSRYGWTGVVANIAFFLCIALGLTYMTSGLATDTGRLAPHRTFEG